MTRKIFRSENIDHKGALLSDGIQNHEDQPVNLKRFWTYYKPMVDFLNCGDFQAAARVLEDMALKEGSCPRWRQLMVRFVAEGGEPPDHLHNMMMLDNNDEHLKEYVEARKIPKMETMTLQGDQK